LGWSGLKKKSESFFLILNEDGEKIIVEKGNKALGCKGACCRRCGGEEDGLGMEVF